jgi:hypothetical protein
VKITIFWLFRNTTVVYLSNATDQENGLRYPDMLKSLNDIEKILPREKGNILFAPDALIQKINLQNIAEL